MTVSGASSGTFSIAGTGTTTTASPYMTLSGAYVGVINEQRNIQSKVLQATNTWVESYCSAATDPSCHMYLRHYNAASIDATGLPILAGGTDGTKVLP